MLLLLWKQIKWQGWGLTTAATQSGPVGYQPVPVCDATTAPAGLCAHILD